MCAKNLDSILPGTFVATVDVTRASQMIEDLKDQGFEITTPPHTLFAAKKKGVSCILYQSGKLTVQGKEKGPFIEFYLEPTILQAFTYNYQPSVDLDLTARIGIDESGKGDFFGPLCVAGVYASSEQIEKLHKIGVKDSKKLKDANILKIASQIRHECVYHVVRINPKKYNELITKFGNLNRLLAWGHATAIEQLFEKTGCRRIIVDQFAYEHVVLSALERKKLDLEVLQRHRAEEDLVVAAASILARAAFVESLQQLEQQFNQSFPKGASHKTIEAGRLFVREHGREKLEMVCKLHFKTLDSITNKN